MKQKGFIFLPILLVVAAIVGASIIYLQKSKEITKNEPEKNPVPEETHFELNPTPTTKTSIVSPTPTKKPIPTPTPTPTPTKSTCTINMLTSQDNPLAVTLVYSVQITGNKYMTGAQWDFDGDGNWDTGLSQSNGTISHTYTNQGTYTAKLQLKMSDGEITDTCTKSITVPYGATVRLTGQVYKDINCNDIKEPNEKGIAGVTINIFRIPEWSIYTTITSDGNGYYNLTRVIDSGNNLTIQPGDIAASGYKIHAQRHTITLNSNQPAINKDLPQVPNTSVGLCSY